MIGFVMIGTNDLKKSSLFYDVVLSELDLIKVLTNERYIGYAEKNTPKTIQLYVTKPYNKELATNGNGTMIAFLAKSKDQVNRFHEVALNNGALNEGLPGPRPSGALEYYCYIRDLNNNKICVYCIS